MDPRLSRHRQSKELKLIQAKGSSTGQGFARPIDEADRLSSYARLLGQTQEFFREESIRRLLPARRGDQQFGPILETERIALQFLIHGGKRFRPFVTLAAYDALQEDRRSATNSPSIPLSVERSVVAIEAFHKASLVHDDIEDDDLFRYGLETLHRQHGVATAINVGDYLVGLGYRWITESREELGAACASDVLHRLMDAHVRLSEGQGAELAWRQLEDKTLPIDAARAIYELKTVPAFEAALYVGVRLAGPATPYEELLSRFSHELGLGFQILNDLKDWEGDPLNKVVAGQDVHSLRPTMLLAIAMQSCTKTESAQLVDQMKAGAENGSDHLRSLMARYEVIEQAREMVRQHRAGALDWAQRTDHQHLSSFLEFLTRQILSDAGPIPTTSH
jgi:geranylgeranyl pyrophosphate synthase